MMGVAWSIDVDVDDAEIGCRSQVLRLGQHDHPGSPIPLDTLNQPLVPSVTRSLSPRNLPWNTASIAS
jgi:hypothetical protein